MTVLLVTHGVEVGRIVLHSFVFLCFSSAAVLAAEEYTCALFDFIQVRAFCFTVMRRRSCF